MLSLTAKVRPARQPVLPLDRAGSQSEIQASGARLGTADTASLIDTSAFAKTRTIFVNPILYPSVFARDVPKLGRFSSRLASIALPLNQGPWLLKKANGLVLRIDGAGIPKVSINDVSQARAQIQPPRSARNHRPSGKLMASIEQAKASTAHAPPPHWPGAATCQPNWSILHASPIRSGAEGKAPVTTLDEKLAAPALGNSLSLP
jgi:hypothetical protein